MLKRLLDSINPYKQDSGNEFGDYLSTITASPKDIEKRKKEEEKKKNLEELEAEKKRFDDVIEKMKQATIECAQCGKRELSGVIGIDGFERFGNEESLQMLKLFYGTGIKLYKYEQATELKRVLKEKLDAIGIKNKVYVETGQGWSYVTKYRYDGTPHKVKELSARNAGYHVICFKLKW